jgi:hypothetical protein
VRAAVPATRPGPRGPAGQRIAQLSKPIPLRERLAALGQGLTALRERLAALGQGLTAQRELVPALRQRS